MQVVVHTAVKLTTNHLTNQTKLFPPNSLANLRLASELARGGARPTKDWCDFQHQQRTALLAPVNMSDKTNARMGWDRIKWDEKKYSGCDGGEGLGLTDMGWGSAGLG